MSKGKGGFRPGGMGGFDLGALQKQAQEMQQKMVEAQQALDQELVTGTAGGGAVTVVMNGHYKVSEVKIAPEAAQDVEMLQDLIVAAFTDGFQKAEELAKTRMSSVTGGLSLPGLT